ncbi:Uncharacterized protein Rs2_39836 [Raphanus sativus]|nr:Uncharacterized protein Rs2_39836 [Raphanus sativus]
MLAIRTVQTERISLYKTWKRSRGKGSKEESFDIDIIVSNCSLLKWHQRPLKINVVELAPRVLLLLRADQIHKSRSFRRRRRRCTRTPITSRKLLSISVYMPEEGRSSKELRSI